MNKNIWLGMLAVVTTLVAPTLPVKADPIFVRAVANVQIITTSGSWTTVNGTLISINIPAGQRRLVVGRFSAESTCLGPTGIFSWCGVRIVALKGATTTEFAPKPATDFQFDSTDLGRETDNSSESHAVNRSAILGPGTYLVFVQAQLFGATNHILDDAHFEVELTTP